MRFLKTIFFSIFLYHITYSQNIIENRYSNQLPTLNSLGNVINPINEGQIITFSDIYFNKSIQCFSYYNPKFWVEFEYDMNNKNTIISNKDFEAKVVFRVDYWDGNNLNTTSAPSGSKICTLSLSHKKALANKNIYKSIYNINHPNKLHHIKVSILYGTQIPVNFQDIISIKIASNAVFYKNINFTGITNFNAVWSPEKSKANISWFKNLSTSCNDPCDEYDVEWAFVDEESYFKDENFDYLNNNLSLNQTYPTPFENLTYSRITTKKNRITDLPLLFTNGYLVFRIREVFYNSLNGRIEGPWIYSENKNVFFNSYKQTFFLLKTIPHESNLNWHSTVSFAEDAKFKGNVSYYDGTLRDRQQVTLNNSVNTIIVQESFYDKEGRKAVTALPTPELISKEFKFYKNFNVSKNTNKPYSFIDFENHSICNQIPNELSTLSGASKYYSPVNNLSNISFNAFVPNAEGYPIQVSKFSNDNLNRVISSGGVGKMFQPGARETKYFYGKAGSEEIERIFGTDVGSNSHYFKNMVQDPNGQLSITYSDMAGKTIATSLAGSASNDAIIKNTNNPTDNPITNKLIKPKDFVVDYSNEIAYGEASNLVSGNQVMKFIAKANSNSYNDTCTRVTCSDCYYDLNIKVKSNCVLDAKDIDTTFYNYNKTEPIDTSCNTKLASINDSFELNTPTGEYYVSASITIPEDIIHYYTMRYLDSGKCFPELDSLIKKHKARMSPCFSNCEECNEYYSNTEERVNRMIENLVNGGQKFKDLSDSLSIRSKLEEYVNAAKQGCDSLCKEENECEVKYHLLKADVSPGGQYALFYDTTNTFFYKDSLPDCIEDLKYKKPGWRFFNDGTSVINASNFTTEGIKKMNGNDFDLSTPEGIVELVNEWDESFSDKLIKYHPEYCYYQYCIQNEAHFNFIRNLDKIETWNEAVIKGYLFNNNGISLNTSYQTSSDLLLANDPFFNTSLSSGASLYSQVQNLMKNYPLYTKNNNNFPISIFDLAMIQANPKLWKYKIVRGVVQHEFNYNYLDTCDCQGLKDVIWNNFKNLYKKIVMYKYEDVRKSNCINNVPNYLGVLNPDLRGVDKDNFFFNEDIKHKFLLMLLIQPFQKPYFYYKMPRFFNYHEIEEQFNSKMQTLILLPNGQKKTDKQIKEESVEQLKNKCDTNCMNMADGWLAALDECFTEPLSKLQQQKFKEDLAAVCMSACGMYPYFMGAKTSVELIPSVLLPNKGVYVATFQEVIDLYTNNAANPFCSQDLIDFPPTGETNSNLYKEHEEIIMKDTCICNRLSNFVDLNVALLDLEDLHSRLQSKFGLVDYHINISELENLIKLCKKNDKICIYSPEPIRIPNIFSCNNYTDCKKIKAAFNNLFRVYPFLQDIQVRTANHKNKKLFVSFLNNMLSMNYTYERYVTLEYIECANCNYNVLECESLLEEYQNFQKLKKLYPSKFNVTDSEFENFNLFLGRPTTTEHLIELLKNCGVLPSCNQIKLCMESYRNHINDKFGLQILKGESSFSFVYLSNMKGYFDLCLFNYNNAFSTADYLKLLKSCGIEISAKLGCEEFRLLLDNFKQKHGYLDPTDIEKTNKFKDFLSIQLGNPRSDYDTLDVEKMIKNCTICNFNCEQLMQVIEKFDLNVNDINNQDLENVKNELQNSFDLCTVDLNQVKSAFEFFRCSTCKITCFELVSFFNNSNMSTNIKDLFIYNKDNPDVRWMGTNSPSLNHILTTVFTKTPINNKTILSKADKINILISELYKDPKFKKCRFNNYELEDILNKMYNSPPFCGRGGASGSPCTTCGSSGSTGSSGSSGTSSEGIVVDNCCIRFKDAWNSFAGKEMLTTTTINQTQWFNAKEALRRHVQHYFSQFNVLGCPTITKAYIEKMLKECLKFKPKTVNDWPDDGDNEEDWPPYDENNNCCKNRINNSCVDSLSLSFAFKYPYTYNVQFAALSPAIPLPPPVFPHPLDNLNNDPCSRMFFDRPFAPKVELDTNQCQKQMENLAISAALHEYNVFREEASQSFRKKYIAKCLSAANASVTTKGISNEFQYTLYYYGQDGNLLRTVPPAGVNPITNQATLQQIEADRKNKIANTPVHSLATDYKYNSLNQVIEQTTPDAGLTRFAYDQLGRLIVSQNAQQQLESKYSYTLYDNLGRINESGEIQCLNQCINGYFGLDYVWYHSFHTAITNLKQSASTQTRYVTRTYYDQTKFTDPAPHFGGIQQNLRKRIATITLDTLDTDKSENTYHTALHYSYDVLGNVKTLVSENKILPTAMINQRFKTLNYDYDLVSGKVNKVFYQKDQPDQFIYRYQYDADNRITEAQTSTDGIYWDKDATYQYYLHGPLARTLIGEQEVQGIDYAYTLQGWLKSINASHLQHQTDMGQDGLAGTTNANTARDAVALSLRYFSGDYQQIGRTTQPIEASLPTAMYNLNLYNGNISSQVVSLKGLSQPTLAYQYRYDQLNRLVQMDAYQPQGTSFGMTTDYQERISYDPNGNILTYNRNKHNGQAMDQLTYNYHPTKKNQLQQVRDAIGHQADSNDIDDQTHAQNYKYDAIGNLIRDEQENMDIFWTPTGKISKINQGNKKITLIFAYDPMGNRISKTVMDMTGKRNPATTYYTRDAQGNTMAVYDNTYYKSDFVACEIDRGMFEDIYNYLLQIKEQAMQSEDPNHYQNLLEQYIRNRWQEDSCRYKYIQKLGAMSLPCNLPAEYYNFIQQLYYQDFEYINSLGEDEKKTYLKSKYNEYYAQMGEYTLCFVQELEKAFTQPQETFQEWLQAQMQIDFQNQKEQFFAEFQQIPVNYGTITDTAYTDSLFWSEQHLYGSSRLGMAKPNVEVTNYTPSNQISYTSNFRNYELTNHLGNVLSTIKDEKQQIDANNDGIVDYYEPIVITANDYYPFGMVMPNRTFSLSSKSYRFGFNTQEKDDEVYGAGNLNTAEFWEYDTRIGRRWNVDPKPNVSVSPYATFENNPIWKNDIKGDSGVSVTLALTLGFSIAGNISEEIGFGFSTSEVDLIGIRNNEFFLFGNNLSTDKVHKRFYFGATFLGLGSYKEAEATRDAGQPLSSKPNVISNETNIVTPISKTNANGKGTQTKLEVGAKAAVLVGAEVSVQIPLSKPTPVNMKKVLSEAERGLHGSEGAKLLEMQKNMESLKKIKPTRRKVQGT
jgi:YD repeat-containing protein